MYKIALAFIFFLNCQAMTWYETLKVPVNAPWYTILGVSESATPREINLAMRRVSLQYHPDRAALQGLSEELATRITQEINAAAAIGALNKTQRSTADTTRIDKNTRDNRAHEEAKVAAERIRKAEEERLRREKEEEERRIQEAAERARKAELEKVRREKEAEERKRQEAAEQTRKAEEEKEQQAQALREKEKEEAARQTLGATAEKEYQEAEAQWRIAQQSQEQQQQIALDNLLNETHATPREEIEKKLIGIINLVSRIELKERIVGVAWSPDGTKIAFAEQSGLITIWDTTKNTTITQWQPIAFNSLPRMLIANNARLLLYTNTTLQSYAPHQEKNITITTAIHSATLSDDGTMLAYTTETGNQDVLIIMDSATQTAQNIILQQPRTPELLISPNKEFFLLFNDNIGYLLHMKNSKMTNTVLLGSKNFAWSPDNTKLASFGWDQIHIFSNSTQYQKSEKFLGIKLTATNIHWPNNDTICLTAKDQAWFIAADTGSIQTKYSCDCPLAYWNNSGSQYITIRDTIISLYNSHYAFSENPRYYSVLEFLKNQFEQGSPIIIDQYSSLQNIVKSAPQFMQQLMALYISTIPTSIDLKGAPSVPVIHFDTNKLNLITKKTFNLLLQQTFQNNDPFIMIAAKTFPNDYLFLNAKDFKYENLLPVLMQYPYLRNEEILYFSIKRGTPITATFIGTYQDIRDKKDTYKRLKARFNAAAQPQFPRVLFQRAHES